MTTSTPAQTLAPTKPERKMRVGRERGNVTITVEQVLLEYPRGIKSGDLYEAVMASVAASYSQVSKSLERLRKSGECVSNRPRHRDALLTHRHHQMTLPPFSSAAPKPKPAAPKVSRYQPTKPAQQRPAASGAIAPHRTAPATLPQREEMREYGGRMVRVVIGPTVAPILRASEPIFGPIATAGGRKP